MASQRKKLTASPMYMTILERDLELYAEEFQIAKTELYKYTATAKIGQGPFEQARTACVEIQKRIAWVHKEIARVKKELKRVSEV